MTHNKLNQMSKWSVDPIYKVKQNYKQQLY